MKKLRKKFTLIELLVVIGLATMLMTIMLPAFNRMISGNAVDRAASELKLALEHAQSIAVSSRKYTAIILPSGNTTLWTTAAEQKARLGGYRFCFVNDFTTSSDEIAIFQNWVPESEWKKPIQGARLLQVTNSPPALTNGIFKINDSSSLLQDTIRLGSSSAQLKTINNYNGSDAKSFCAIIFSPYGEMKNTDDVYLIVGETQAIPSAEAGVSNLVFPGSSNNGPANVKALHINRITGAVEYYSVQ